MANAQDKLEVALYLMPAALAANDPIWLSSITTQLQKQTTISSILYHRSQQFGKILLYNGQHRQCCLLEMELHDAQLKLLLQSVYRLSLFKSIASTAAKWKQHLEQA